MAKLINGNGNSAVYAAEDSDWFAAIMGNTTAITAIGEQFRADQADANTIEIFDGVIITQEGRRIQLDANDVDLFEIPTGTPGDTSYYIIGYHLVTDTDSNQFCETFVQKMDDGSETIPENTFRGGADDVYISLYRVTQTGLNITSIDLILPSISNIGKLKASLTELEEEINIPTLTSVGLNKNTYSGIGSYTTTANYAYNSTYSAFMYIAENTNRGTITFDLGVSKIIRKIQLKISENVTNDFFDFYVQISNDQKTWTNIYSGVLINSDWQDRSNITQIVNSERLSARYVRLINGIIITKGTDMNFETEIFKVFYE